MSTGVATQELLQTLDTLSTSGQLPRHVTGITQDSRRVKPGNVFAARHGGRADGANYLKQAKEKGAVLLLVEGEPPPDAILPVVEVKSFNPALVKASGLIYANPSRRLNLFGVTGTNGKTSTVHILRSIFEATGSKCAMLSTVGYWTGTETIEAPLTTPEIDQISTILDDAANGGAQFATMEVSSHALDKGRVWGLKFAGAGFTNLSVDHLDYHKTMLQYSIAKESFFRALPLSATSSININSSWGSRMVRAAWGPVLTVGTDDSGADLRVSLREHTVAGGSYRLEWQDKVYDVSTKLVGVYQGENLAIAAAMALAKRIDPATILKGIADLKAVPGRMEAVDCGQPFALFVDYAHSPDALQRAIRSLRPLTKGKVLVMFGCGGERDKTKRPQMGKIASEEADKVFITSDNPRTEDPTTITEEIYAGVWVEDRPKVKVIVSRREATLAILREATAGDIVLLAGKGSEWYQEINNIRHNYDDRIVAAEALHEVGFKERDK